MKVKFLGEASERSLHKRVKNVAGAGKLSHCNGNVMQVLASSEGYEEDLKVIGRITRSGHKSIIEHDYIQLAICDVTPIIEQILIGFRPTAFTIKSRRYVDFRNVGFYTPVFRSRDGSIHMKNRELRLKYRKHMRFLFDEYSAMVDGGINKEDARFILPYSFYSNIFMTVNAREFEKMIIYLLHSNDSNIQEVSQLGEAFLKIAEQYVPYIVPNIEKFKSNESKFEYRSILREYSYDVKILNKPMLVDCTSNPDAAILETAVMGETQCRYDEAWRIVFDAEMEAQHFRRDYMDAIIRKPENRELEQINFTWQIPISLSILTHLTRHRMHSLITPSFVPLWNFSNYIIPETIRNSVFLDRYEKAIEENRKLMEEFIEDGVMEEDLVYFYLGCQMCNVTTTMNGREFMWITRMRSCNRAQWQIREIVNNMIEETKKVAPLFSRGLGPTCEIYHYCPEGKLSCGRIKEILESDRRQ